MTTAPAEAKAPAYSRPTDEQVAAGYAWAMRHAGFTAGRFPALGELAVDAATDGVLWAASHWLPDRGPFDALVQCAVRRFVGRALTRHGERRQGKPDIVPLGEDFDLPAPPDLGRGLPLECSDLPDDERNALFLYGAGYNLRDCALLMGLAPEQVRQLLHRAAEHLAPGAPKPVRRNGEKRLAAG